MKKQVMQRAWEIAKQASKETGYSAKVFLKESLKIAWAEVKSGKQHFEGSAVYVPADIMVRYGFKVSESGETISVLHDFGGGWKKAAYIKIADGAAVINPKISIEIASYVKKALNWFADNYDVMIGDVIYNHTEKMYGGEYGKFSESTVQDFISKGCKRWTKEGHDRIYIKNLAYNVGGLYMSSYNKYAEIKGDEISYKTAERIISYMSNMYIDLNTGDVIADGNTSEQEIIDVTERVIDYIKSKRVA